MICCILGQTTKAAASVCSIIAVTSQNSRPQFHAAAMEAKHEQETLLNRSQAFGHCFPGGLQSLCFLVHDFTQVAYHCDGKQNLV